MLVAVAIAVLAVAELGACSSGAMRYHTLSNYADLGATTSGVVTSKDSDTLLIEVLPVRTSDVLKTSRLMLGNSDGSMTPAQADAWAAPLPEELRAAISQALQQRLGAVDLYTPSDAGNARRIQVSMALTRADFSGYGRFLGVIEWSVAALPVEERLVGRTSLNVDIVAGAAGQVTAFQKLSNSVAADVAVAARTMASYIR